MTPDLYVAWLTAGDWLTHTWPWLITAACALFAVWAFCQAIGDDYRTSDDQQPIPDPPAVDTQPGTDLDLLIDAELAYGTQTRKETPQP